MYMYIYMYIYIHIYIYQIFVYVYVYVIPKSNQRTHTDRQDVRAGGWYTCIHIHVCVPIHIRICVYNPRIQTRGHRPP